MIERLGSALPYVGGAVAAYGAVQLIDQLFAQVLETDRGKKAKATAENYTPTIVQTAAGYRHWFMLLGALAIPKVGACVNGLSGNRFSWLVSK